MSTTPQHPQFVVEPVVVTVNRRDSSSVCSSRSGSVSVSASATPHGGGLITSGRRRSVHETLLFAPSQSPSTASSLEPHAAVITTTVTPPLQSSGDGTLHAATTSASSLHLSASSPAPQQRTLSSANLSTSGGGVRQRSTSFMTQQTAQTSHRTPDVESSLPPPPDEKSDQGNESESDSDDNKSDHSAGSHQEHTGGFCQRPEIAPALESSSMHLFEGDNPARIFIYNVIHTRGFEGVIITIILTNCVLLALDDPTVDEQPAYQTYADYFFTAAFTVEMFLKMFAFGILRHEGAYLRNGWNILDFIIVILSYLQFLPGFGKYSGIRAVRVLRPLRSMNAIPPLKVIVSGLLASLRALVNVLLLMAFIFGTFGIVGVQLWHGNLRYRCREISSGIIDEERFCTTGSSWNGLNGRECDAGSYCYHSVNPNFGYTSFDNVLWAFLLIIQCITVEGWAEIMYSVMDSGGPATCIYFIFLILTGSYFLLNLALAVINNEFTDAKKKMIDRQETDKLQEEEMEKLERNELILAVHRASIADARKAMELIARRKDGAMSPKVLSSSTKDADMNAKSPSAPIADQEEVGKKSGAVGIAADQTTAVDDVASIGEHSLTAEGGGPRVAAVTATSGVSSFADEEMQIARLGADGVLMDDAEDGATKKGQEYCIARGWRKLRLFCFWIVEGDIMEYRKALEQKDSLDATLFTKFIVLCILLNTIVLAAEHYPQSDTQSDISEFANYIFSAIFAVELVIKLIALGIRRYTRDNFNNLDAFVVITSGVELFLMEDGRSKFTVFRAFRLLRVFKLLKNFPSLRNIVEVMLHAVTETGYLNIIILLYIFIAALIGMQFFGGMLRNVETEDEPIRSTFDSFYYSVLTVFQILTRDAWPNVMWNAMRVTHETASLYFLFCVFTGDFIILNLFLAILISSFEQIGSVNRDGNEDDNTDLDYLAQTMIADGATHTAGSGAVNHRTEGVTNVLLPPSVGLFLSDERAKAPPLATNILRLSSGVNLTSGAAVGGGKKHNQPDTDNDNDTAIVDFGTGGNNHHSNDDDNGEEMEDAAIFTQSQGPGIGGSPYADVYYKEEEAVGQCSKCLDPIIKPFPPAAKSIRPISSHELHSRVCHIIQARKAKERVIEELLFDLMVDEEEETQAGVAKGGGGAAGATKATANRRWSASSMSDFGGSDMDRSILSSMSGGGGVGTTASGAAGGKGPRASRRDVHPTPRRVEEVFGRAWEVGLLLNERLERCLYMDTWEPLVEALKAEQQVLRLRVGEEQIGRGLVAYTRANIPREMLTNGGNSLFVFGPHNKLRVACTAIVTHPMFDRIILFIILCSSLAMALDNPRNSGEMADALENMGYFFTAVFILEMVLKVIALGFIAIPHAYLRDNWNVLDFFIVCVAIISLILKIFSSIDVSFLKVLRTIRGLRPLRVINRNRGIKMVVITLLQSIKGIANVALISLLIYIVFAILGVQLFAGTMFFCSDGSVHYRSNCTGNFTFNESIAVTRPKLVSVLNNASGNMTLVNSTTEFERTGAFIDVVSIAPRVWQTYKYNFDNTYNSFITLFVIATLDDWSITMYRAIDATGVDSGPTRNYAPWMGLFFVVFIVVGSFFLLNMFVGVIIFNFNDVKAQLDGLSLLTTEQKLWVETQRMMLNFRPTIRRKPWFEGSYYYVENPMFEVLIGFFILLNIIVISMEFHGQSGDFDTFQFVSNVIFTFVFFVEMFMKILAYGVQKYLNNGWDRFDCFLVIISIIDVSMGDGTVPINVGLLRVLRIFRIMRMLQLVKKAKNVRILLETLWYSFPSLANIGAFLILVVFIYSVLGVQIFALVKRRGDLDHHANFETFFNSFLMLVRTATMDNWGTVMLALMDTSDCGRSTNEQGVDDCGTPFAPLYFISFIVIAGFVMVNLFIAIILDNFDTTMKLDRSKLKMADLKKFSEAWALFDEDATMTIETSKFPSLLAMLKPPLGVSRRTDRVALLLKCEQFDIPEHGGVIHFAETLIPLARSVMGIKFEEADIREHEENWRLQFPDLNDLRILRYRQKRVTVDQYLAATFIGAAYRRTCAIRLADRLREERIEAMNDAYDAQDVSMPHRTAVHGLKHRMRLRYLARQSRIQVVEDRLRSQSIAMFTGNDDTTFGDTTEEFDDGEGGDSLSLLGGTGSGAPAGGSVARQSSGTGNNVEFQFSVSEHD